MSDIGQKEMNLRVNRVYAREWVEMSQSQMFKIKENGHVHSLKAFLNSDEKILWLEFKTTGPKPSFSCPFSLFEDPYSFRSGLDSEWAKLMKIANAVINPVEG